MWRIVMVLLAASCAAPQIQVSQTKPKGFCGQSVVVIGAVATPGRFDVRETRTLIEAIDRAGGFTKEAHLNSVTLERCAGERWEEFRIECSRVQRGGVGDLALKDGDIVRVPTYD